MGERIRKLLRSVDAVARVCGYLSGCLVLLMMVLILAEVVMRYAVDRPLMISDEFSGYMLVVLSYLGLGYAWKEKAHVRVTTVVNMLPGKWPCRLRLVSLLLGLGFAALLIKLSCDYLIFSFSVHMASSTWLRTPLQIPQMALPIGFLVLLLTIAADIAKTVPPLIAEEKPPESAS
jgi:TRAP-type C4-dicarboxylate transport system permease small subunit